MQDAQLLRYARHILLPEVGVEAQEQWLQSKALLVGAGGLGCAAGLYLAAAGLGHITVVDHDVIELSNLQRQIAHGTQSIGLSKAESLAAQMRAINPEITVIALTQRASGKELAALVAEHDIVLDCTDNFNTRHDINAACVASHKPLVSASALGFNGQLLVIHPKHSTDHGCYACLYPPEHAPEEVSCATNGVLGPVVGTMGSMQASQALLTLAGIGQPMIGRLLLHDALHGVWSEIRIPRNPACTVCGHS